ncbi:hypothetical protein LOC67_16835 [Stieleria sp. JC731]|uniref:hypothetical protein n=1 Tax=Stieleria sp. JC731 TaxID=2894195 RepID=UPI001E3FBB52|nr:hypothetical protein [Stieleria sp. JC731]MCC9602223.1 hypothetical protein [Stieleria sp. JC731]
MLELDDPRWSELEHAYGNAVDTPRLLNQLHTKKGLTKSYWEKLWSSLCHQCSTYSASFAAFPHLVSAARSLSVKQGTSTLDLAAGILTCSYDDNKLTNRIPGELRKPFIEAIADGKQLLAEMITESRKSRVDSMRYLWMIAAFDGHPEVVGLLWTVVDDFCCPVCGDDIIDPYESLCGL